MRKRVRTEWWIDEHVVGHVWNLPGEGPHVVVAQLSCKRCCTSHCEQSRPPSSHINAAGTGTSCLGQLRLRQGPFSHLGQFYKAKHDSSQAQVLKYQMQLGPSFCWAIFKAFVSGGGRGGEEVRAGVARGVGARRVGYDPATLLPPHTCTVTVVLSLRTAIVCLVDPSFVASFLCPPWRAPRCSPSVQRSRRHVHLAHLFSFFRPLFCSCPFGGWPVPCHPHLCFYLV